MNEGENNPKEPKMIKWFVYVLDLEEKTFENKFLEMIFKITKNWRDQSEIESQENTREKLVLDLMKKMIGDEDICKIFFRIFRKMFSITSNLNGKK